MKKSKWLDCQGNKFFPKQKGTPSLVKIEHKNTATLDSARSKKKSKVAVLQLRQAVLNWKEGSAVTRRARGWSLTGVTVLWSLSKTHLS